MEISYCITVCDEHKELHTLLSKLHGLIEDNDEVIVLRDMDKTNSEVNEVLNHFISLYKGKLIVIDSHLNNDFASFKNQFLDWAVSDYIFQIDADEVPNDFLIENIKEILKINRDIDCFYIPRVNKVEGITQEHINKWRWRVDEQQRINFPDPQMRLFKFGKGIKWKNKVHEVLDGYKTVSMLPHDTEDFCLYHIKSIDKQEKQNSYYETI
jgi:hypothetical protein